MEDKTALQSLRKSINEKIPSQFLVGNIDKVDNTYYALVTEKENYSEVWVIEVKENKLKDKSLEDFIKDEVQDLYNSKNN